MALKKLILKAPDVATLYVLRVKYWRWLKFSTSYSSALCYNRSMYNTFMYIQMYIVGLQIFVTYPTSAHNFINSKFSFVFASQNVCSKKNQSDSSVKFLIHFKT
jgi:hypothetical protein